MKNRSIAAIGKAEKKMDNYAFSASNISFQSVGKEIDPIISIDDFRMRQPVFQPHPHAGFAAITYLFEDSEGEFVSRDSLGGNLEAKPGGVIWNVAGRGLLHDEHPKVAGQMAHGLQIFVNLSAPNKLCDPEVLFVDGPDIPLFSENGTEVRVVSGSAGNVEAKINPPENITLLDIKLESDSTFVKTLPVGENILLYVIKGSISVGNEETLLTKSQTAVMDFDGDSVRLTANEDAQVVLLAGKPHREELVFGGPFIMNTEQQINEAIDRYHAGEMGDI